MNARPGPELAGRAYMKRLGLALAQASSSSVVVGTCLTRSGAYSRSGPPGEVTTMTPWPCASPCIFSAEGSKISLSFGRLSAMAGNSSTHNFCSMPAASPSEPVSTMSMSTRPASCCAFNFPGSSGAGAFVKVILETRLGFAFR